MRRIVKIKEDIRDYYWFQPGECYLVQNDEIGSHFIVINHPFNHALLKRKYSSESKYKKRLEENGFRITRKNSTIAHIDENIFPNSQNAIVHLRESIDMINVFET